RWEPTPPVAPVISTRLLLVDSVMSPLWAVLWPRSRSGRDERSGGGARRRRRVRRERADLVPQALHARIELGGRTGGVVQLAAQRGGQVPAVLVGQLVLGAGPEVHRDRAHLQLHRDQFGMGGEVYRHPHDEVQRAVAVGLRRGDVVLDREHLEIALAAE